MDERAARIEAILALGRTYAVAMIGAALAGAILGASVAAVTLDDGKPEGPPVVIIQESDGSFGVQRI